MKNKIVRFILCVALAAVFTTVYAENNVASAKTEPSVLNTDVKTAPAAEKAGNQATARDNGGASVGGDLKFYLYDKLEGKSVGTETSQPALNGLTSFYLFISKELSDSVSLDIEPKFSISASATPKLGAKIGKDITSSPTPSIGFVRAQITVKLPENVELTAGALRTLFTEDYGAQLWYGEEFYGNYASCGGYYGTLDDTGIELYKNFELGPVSLPSYLYVLGGAGSLYVDNNNTKAVLVHITPQIGMFKFLGSYFRSMDSSDNNPITRYAAGVAINYENFMFRTEFTIGQWDNVSMYANLTATDFTKTVRNLTPQAYYIKAGYKLFPWLRVMLVYAHYDQDFTNADKNIADTTTKTVLGYTVTSKQSFAYETYTEISPVLNFYVTPDSTIYAQMINVQNTRDGDNCELKYNRFVLGWRTTF